MSSEKIDLIKRISSLSWWKWVVGIDLFLIFITIIYQHIWIRYFRLFNMAAEMNISVWWHGISLLAASLLAYELFSTRKDGSRKAWLSLSIIMLVFSLDEIGSFHERISLTSSLKPYFLPLLILLFYSLSILFRKQDTRKSAIFLLIGFILYGSVVAQEMIEHAVTFPGWAKGIRVGIEEGSELVGTLMVLSGIVCQRSHRYATESLSIVIPKTYTLKSLPSILFIGFILHILLSVYSSNITDTRGIPAIWFPSAIFFILFCDSYWKSLNNHNSRGKDYLLISAYFLLSSMGAIQIYGTQISSPYYFYLFQLPVMVILIWAFEQISKKNIIILIAISLALTISYMYNILVIWYIVTGIISCLIMIIFLRFPKENFGNHYK